MIYVSCYSLVMKKFSRKVKKMFLEENQFFSNTLISCNTMPYSIIKPQWTSGLGCFNLSNFSNIDVINV